MPASILLRIALLVAILLGGYQRVLMPPPNLYVGSETYAVAGVVAQHQNNVVDVFYVTDRKPVERKDPRKARRARLSLYTINPIRTGSV